MKAQSSALIPTHRVIALCTARIQNCNDNFKRERAEFVEQYRRRTRLFGPLEDIKITRERYDNGDGGTWDQMEYNLIKTVWEEQKYVASRILTLAMETSESVMTITAEDYRQIT